MGTALSVTICEGETKGGRALRRRVLWEGQLQFLHNTFAIGRISFVDMTKLPLLNLRRDDCLASTVLSIKRSRSSGVSFVGGNEGSESQR